MAAAFVCVVGKVDVRDFGEERSWVFCKWVKCEAVEYHCEDLRQGQ